MSKLGRCIIFKVSPQLKPGAIPAFCNPRRIPFAVKHAVEEELERLVEKHVLEHINYSELAAPIVAVCKPNGTVRICGDFKAEFLNLWATEEFLTGHGLLLLNLSTLCKLNLFI